jgi:hypothetical protein
MWQGRTPPHRPRTPPSAPSGPVPGFPRAPFLPPQKYDEPHSANDRGKCKHPGSVRANYHGRCMHHRPAANDRGSSKHHGPGRPNDRGNARGAALKAPPTSSTASRRTPRTNRRVPPPEHGTGALSTRECPCKHRRGLGQGRLANERFTWPANRRQAQALMLRTGPERSLVSRTSTRPA